MLYIKNFVHDLDSSAITFDVEREGVSNRIVIKKSDYGTILTDIDTFTEEWSDAEYEQLDEFVSGCSGIVYSFYH